MIKLVVALAAVILAWLVWWQWSARKEQNQPGPALVAVDPWKWANSGKDAAPFRTCLVGRPAKNAADSTTDT